MKLACPTPELSIENTDKGSKAERRKFQDFWKSKFSWFVYDSSNDVIYCDFCRKAGPGISILLFQNFY